MRRRANGLEQGGNDSTTKPRDSAGATAADGARRGRSSQGGGQATRGEERRDEPWGMGGFYDDVVEDAMPGGRETDLLQLGRALVGAPARRGLVSAYCRWRRRPMRCEFVRAAYRP